MEKMKLTIDLLPQGAWGNDLSKTLAKKDWDTLRKFCYEKYKHKCGICGIENVKLDAHEVWEFDEEKSTQTLVNIIALCSKCHGVKHMRNSERLGYADSAKKHFMNINKCNSILFAKHYAEQKIRFEFLGKILRWKMILNIDNLGGKGIEVRQRNIPLIISNYNHIDWSNVKISRNNVLEKIVVSHSLSIECDPIICRTQQDPHRVYSVRYFAVREGDKFPPKINCIFVNNYIGTITIDTDRVNKIEWYAASKLIKTVYNVGGRLISEFNVQDLKHDKFYFKIVGDGGKVFSEEFKLVEA